MKLQVVIPPKLVIDIKRMTSAIDKALDNAAIGAQADFVTTTATWEHKPAFDVKKGPGERTVYTSDEIYRYVSGGTRVRRVIMTPGFSPKSRYRFIGSNKGSGGVMVGPSKKIARPGIKAREFEKAIAIIWERELPRELQRAIDEAVK